MPPKRRKRVKSAKERIEKTPEIAIAEMAWYRSKPGELRAAAKNRRLLDEVFLKRPEPTDKSVLHTILFHLEFSLQRVTCGSSLMQ